MSFFPGTISYHQHPQPQQTTFGPLFRLLEDFDQYSSNKDSSQQQQHRGTSLRTFQPKFDVQEHTDSYELHGELPGVEQKDVDIEFVDRQTLTIKGKIERSSQSSSDPSSSPKQVEGATAPSNNKSHKATVEDEDAAIAAESKSGTDVAKKAGAEVTEKPTTAPGPKFWVSERTVGQFARSFSFPDSVDQEKVKASMKNGILTIVVPKAKKPESRKITIS